MQNLKKVQIHARNLASLLPPEFTPRLFLILGTGLGNLSKLLQTGVEVPFTALEGFPVAGVASHAGKFSAGYLNGVPVLIQEGRFHLYEGKTPEEICLGVRMAAMLGAQTLIITNASGAINPLFEAGNLMVIEDHINCTGQSPLTGPNVEEWGLRFPDMSQVYDKGLILALERAALESGVRLEKGVYLGTFGPQLETPAEIRAFRLMGADAVGMSTIQEIIAARHLGMRVLGIACLTNKNLPDCMAETSIEEIVASAERSGEILEKLLLRLIGKDLA